MSQSFSIQDLELLGYVDAKEELRSRDLQYQSFSGLAIAGIKKIAARFIYLKSDCTKREAEELARSIKRTTDTYIIVPKSIRIRKTTLESIFPNFQIFDHEDIIWNKLESTFFDYNSALQTSIANEKYYVPPRKEDADPKDRLDDEVIECLTGKRNITGKLIVVSASAGVGKTTLARQLTVGLSKRSEKLRLIPAYVEASHWGKLRIETVTELWEIIDNSIRNFSPNLILSEQLFEHSLKHGYLVFIFDGFDELCGHRSSHFKPREVLGRLADICRESNAKIILTTRTLYWQSEIDAPPDNIHLLKLAPFNTQQAKGYFQKYFAEDVKMQDRAMSLYSELIKANVPPTKGGSRVQFVNLPLCVGMIAEYVRLGGTGHFTSQVGKGLVHNVLHQICEREKARKGLLTSAETQLSAFTEIAVDQSGVFMPEFDLELLGIAGFDENDLTRLIDHPLLTTDDGSRYRFNYDFLPQYLRALYISNAIAACNTDIKSKVWEIMCREANGKGFLIEHMLDLLKDNINYLNICYKNVPARAGEAKSFLFHLAKQAIHNLSDYITRDEKATALFSLINDDFTNGKHVNSLYVVGNIDGLNLSGITFSNCTFIDTIFTRCEADETTVFAMCSFSGDLDFQSCDKVKWSRVQLNDCTLLPPSNLVWEDMLGRVFASKEEHLLDAMRLALNKFWHHGILKRSIRKENWRRGSLGHSIYCEQILEAMLRSHLIDEVHISGVPEGGYVFTTECIADLQRFMDNRQLTGKIGEVYNALVNG